MTLNDDSALNLWQLEQVEKGLVAAEAGDFSSEEEIQAAIAKWTL